MYMCYIDAQSKSSYKCVLLLLFLGCKYIITNILYVFFMTELSMFGSAISLVVNLLFSQ